jgi:hypothetical protein
MGRAPAVTCQKKKGTHAPLVRGGFFLEEMKMFSHRLYNAQPSQPCHVHFLSRPPYTAIAANEPQSNYFLLLIFLLSSAPPYSRLSVMNLRPVPIHCFPTYFRPGSSFLVWAQDCFDSGPGMSGSSCFTPSWSSAFQPAEDTFGYTGMKLGHKITGS